MDSDQLDALTGRTEAALVEGIEALCGVLWVRVLVTI